MSLSAFVVFIWTCLVFFMDRKIRLSVVQKRCGVRGHRDFLSHSNSLTHSLLQRSYNEIKHNMQCNGSDEACRTDDPIHEHKYMYFVSEPIHALK